MIRVLVAEDSPTARRLLVSMLTSDPEITVIGEARDGAEAVALAESLRPDLITMDVQMPELDGLSATQQIMHRSPVPIIIVSSQANDGAVELSLEATRAGALIVLPKPEGPLSPRYEEQRAMLVSMAKAMAGVKVVRRWRESTPTESPVFRGTRSVAPSSAPAGAPRATAIPSHLLVPSTRATRHIVAIAASTGGPAAVRELLAELPASFPLPILYVQHIAKGFVGGLAHWLASTTALKVKVAEQGERLMAGTVYVAPDDRHLGLLPGLRVSLSSAPPVGQFRPSGTALFDSVASVTGAGTVAVILTGMGDDGARGLRAVRDAGGLVLAQDEASSVVYGMPREALHAGVTNEVLAISQFAARLVEATRETGTGRKP